MWTAPPAGPASSGGSGKARGPRIFRDYVLKYKMGIGRDGKLKKKGEGKNFGSCLVGALPLDEVEARRRLHDVADLAGLQCKRGVFKLLLHVAPAKEAPTNMPYVSFRIYPHAGEHASRRAARRHGPLRIRQTSTSMTTAGAVRVTVC